MASSNRRGHGVGAYREMGGRWIVRAGDVRPRRGRNLEGRCVSFAERAKTALPERVVGECGRSPTAARTCLASGASSVFRPCEGIAFRRCRGAGAGCRCGWPGTCRRCPSLVAQSAPSGGPATGRASNSFTAPPIKSPQERLAGLLSPVPVRPGLRSPRQAPPPARCRLSGRWPHWPRRGQRKGHRRPRPAHTPPW